MVGMVNVNIALSRSL